MKGLFIKDIISIRKKMIICSLCAALFMIPLAYFEGETDIMSIIEVMLFVSMALFGSLLSYQVMSQDDIDRFDIYKRVLPIKKENVVHEKYIFSFIIILAFSIIGWIIQGICVYAAVTPFMRTKEYCDLYHSSEHFLNLNKWDNIVSNLSFAMHLALPLGLIINATLMFCFYRFGREKVVTMALVIFTIIFMGGYSIISFMDARDIMINVDIPNSKFYIIMYIRNL